MSATEIIIYTTRICPYCIMAKRLLNKKGLSYTEINVEKEAGMREKMMQLSKQRTVPQIFIGDHHVGGFDELYALEINQHLDSLVGSNTAAN